MNSFFKRGDVAVIHSQTGKFAHMNDEEVTIVGPLRLYLTSIGPVMAYSVSHPEYPKGLFAQPSELRPMDWKMKWGEGAWQPDMEIGSLVCRMQELRAQLRGGVARP